MTQQIRARGKFDDHRLQPPVFHLGALADNEAVHVPAAQRAGQGQAGIPVDPVRIRSTLAADERDGEGKGGVQAFPALRDAAADLSVPAH